MPPLHALARLIGAPGKPAFAHRPTPAEARALLDAGPGRNVAVTGAGEAALPPVELPVDAEQARARVLAAVATLQGWELVSFGDHVLWATRTTPIFGFVDDVLVLLTPADGRTRVEARSASRIGGGDLGRNRATLRELIAVLRRWA